MPTSPPQGDSGAVKEAAKLLVNADNPVIAVDRAARTPAGVPLLIELAEYCNRQARPWWAQANQGPQGVLALLR